MQQRSEWYRLVWPRMRLAPTAAGTPVGAMVRPRATAGATDMPQAGPRQSAPVDTGVCVHIAPSCGKLIIKRCVLIERMQTLAVGQLSALALSIRGT